MKIAILYGCKPVALGHDRVSYSYVSKGGSGVYVRMEIAKSTDLAEALDEAKPLPGEVVLNTMEMD